MSWLSLLGIGKGLVKSKWFWIAIVVCVVAFYVARYTTMVEDVQKAYAQVQGLTKSLETTNKSIDVLRSEMERIDTYTIERQSSRDSIRAENEQLKQQLEQERNQNERLQECWDVSVGSGLDGLRNIPDKN